MLTMTPRKPPPAPLVPGEVAFLVTPGELGPSYTPVEVVKVNKATVVVRRHDGRQERVAPEDLARRSAADLPEVPASRAAALVADYTRATATVERARQELMAATALRRAALEDLSTLGWTITDMAERLGLSRSRVHQILHGGD